MSLSKVPKKTEYTNADLAALMHELHSCFHVIDLKVDSHVDIMGKTFTVVRQDLAKVENNLSKVEGKVDTIEHFVLAARSMPVPLAAEEAKGFFKKIRKLTLIEATALIVVTLAGGSNVYQFLVVVARAVDGFLRAKP